MIVIHITLDHFSHWQLHFNKYHTRTSNHPQFHTQCAHRIIQREVEVAYFMCKHENCNKNVKIWHSTLTSRKWRHSFQSAKSFFILHSIRHSGFSQQVNSSLWQYKLVQCRNQASNFLWDESAIGSDCIRHNNLTYNVHLTRSRTWYTQHWAGLAQILVGGKIRADQGLTLTSVHIHIATCKHEKYCQIWL